MSIGGLATRTIGVIVNLSCIVAPSLGRRLAAHLWFTPFPFVKPKHRLPPGRAVWLADSLPGYVIGAGDRTALLIHGWAGSSRQFRRIAEGLADEGYRAIVLDLPGHGDTAGDTVDVYRLARFVEQAWDQYGPIDLVVAHSLGAMATATAIAGGMSIDRLVLLAPGVFPRQALEVFAAQLGLTSRAYRAVEAEMEQRFGRDVWHRIPAAIHQLAAPPRSLIIHDTGDEMVPIRMSRDLASSWGATLIETEGLGHNGVLHSSAVVGAVRAIAAGSGVQSSH